MSSTTSNATCGFCEIVAGRAPAEVVRRWDGVLAVRPRGGGVTDGHVLVLPHQCVPDVGVDPSVSARVMECAAELAAELPSCNLITSKGAAATQTVFHLHIHVTPRSTGDGLQLPWTAQKARAQKGSRSDVKAELNPMAGNSLVDVVMAREPLPGGSPMVFLAGPTPRVGDVPSWRPEAIELIRACWPVASGSLTVLSPESRDGHRAAEYHDQVDWESAARAAATVILFWIPRDLRTLPGFTTNVEFGLDVGLGRRVVLGAPPACPNPERNRYLVYVAKCHNVPVLNTLAEAVVEALALAAS